MDSRLFTVTFTVYIHTEHGKHGHALERVWLQDGAEQIPKKKIFFFHTTSGI